MTVILVLLFKALVDLTFVKIISPAYGYAGMTANINLEKVIFSYLVVLVLGLLLPHTYRRPSDFSLTILLVFVLVPILSLWGLRDEATSFACLAAGSFAFLLILMRIRFLNIRKRLPRMALSRRAYSILGGAFVLALLTRIMARGGLQYFNLNFADVYKLRTIVGRELLSGPWGYIWIWCGKGFLVLGMAVALWSRRWKTFGVLVFLELCLFGFTTHKELVFYPLMIGFVYVCERKNLPLVKTFLLSMSATIGVAALLDHITGNHLFSGLLILRTFDIVGINHFAYYHFFQSHPYLSFSNGILSRLIENPYRVAVPLLIGAGRYGPDSQAFANAGYIASGYMEVGVWGVWGYTAMVVVLMKLFDRLAEQTIPVGLVCAVMAVSIFQLVNVDLPTALFSHGVGVNFVGLAVWNGWRQTAAQPQADEAGGGSVGEEQLAGIVTPASRGPAPEA